MRCSTRSRTISGQSKDSFCYEFLACWPKSMLRRRPRPKRREAKLHPHQDKKRSNRRLRHRSLVKIVSNRSCLKSTLWGSRPWSRDRAIVRVRVKSRSKCWALSSTSMSRCSLIRLWCSVAFSSPTNSKASPPRSQAWSCRYQWRIWLSTSVRIKVSLPKFKRH